MGLFRSRARVTQLSRGLVASLCLTAAAWLLASSAAHPTETIRIALEKRGTVAWQIDVAKARGFDKKEGIEITTQELASTEAGKIALEGAAADLIVSDWLWVARERALGDDLLFTPYSTAAGALLAAKGSPIRTLADLKGRSVGVAGGPIDKNWLMLQALALKGGGNLARDARPAFGAPPLIAEKLAEGELDAALEFWNFSADLESRGFRRVMEMADVEKALGAEGPVAMIGYVCKASFATPHKDALRRFFRALDDARTALVDDPAAWAPVRARMGVKDDAAFEIYKRRFLEGAPKRAVADEARDAAKLFLAIAGIGGPALVGGAKSLDPAAFFDPAD